MKELTLISRGRYELMEAQDRAEWERIRWQTCYLLQPHLSKNKTLRPTDLIKFDWEKDTSDIDIDAQRKRAEFIKKKYELHGKEDKHQARTE